MATFSFLAVGLSQARSRPRPQATVRVTRRRRWVLIGGRIGPRCAGAAATVLVLGAGGVLTVCRCRWAAPAILLTRSSPPPASAALGLALALVLSSMQATIAVSNGIVISLAFISDMFLVSGQMPGWLSALGWAFPLKHLSAALKAGLDPYAVGGAIALDHLAVLVLWGVAGAVAATALLRRQGERAAESSGEASAAAEAPVRPGGTESARRALADSSPAAHHRADSAAPAGRRGAAHRSRCSGGTRSAVFFAVAFPVLLVAVIPSVNGGGDILLDNGQQLGIFYAATMAIYGAAVSAYVNMPQALAEARERGVLKRVGGSPLPAWILLAGRVIGALVVALVTALAIVVLAGVMYHPGPADRPVRRARDPRAGHHLLRRHGDRPRDDDQVLPGTRRREPGLVAQPRLRLADLRHPGHVPARRGSDLLDLPPAPRRRCHDPRRGPVGGRLGILAGPPRRAAAVDPGVGARRGQRFRWEPSG